MSDITYNMIEFPQLKILNAHFTGEHFKIITDFLLKGIAPSEFWFVNAIEKLYINAVGNENSKLDYATMWRWALAQTAQFCIDNRMKTPLGKALQTYIAFERFHDHEAGDIKPEDDILTTAEQWFRVRVLLETLEILEKLMSYARDGSTFAISTISQVSQQFFITNQTSCSSWLSRIYLPMMAVACMNGNYAQVIRLGTFTLRIAERYQSNNDNSKGGITYNTFQKNVGNVISMLRILDLLVRYSEPLSPLINSEMQRTNELVWKEILPQLFARLNHPLITVRNTICTLLERIAIISPHSLCYPAVVGVTEPVEINDDNDEDFNDEQNSFQKNYPTLVANISVFIKEFQRINMLSEERWIFVLSNLDHEINKRVAQIELESTRTFANPHLTNVENAIYIYIYIYIVYVLNQILQIFYVIEDLYERSCGKNYLTADEQQFRDTYGDQIAAALESYEINKSELSKAWLPFKQLLYNFTQGSSKRPSSILQIGDLSPCLSSLFHTKIPLPGQESVDFCDLIFIESINKQVFVLPTKTRPKKLSFIGSDGKEYSFLFKGQEDLHLDERIMQFLCICNLIMTEKRIESPPYSAITYSVTPLGSRSGLIQWVDGATPLFHLYRKWQQRQLNQVGVERPSELFFNRLKIAFKSNVRFFLEFWLRAGSADTWYHVTERFARSAAVMSIIGSILGLGDRHLDNILVNLDSGQLMHIDYNICFDKGRILRVPETVPFRLTGNIVHALGPTQIEVLGTFRLSCEHVLTKLRVNKEVLLRAMDAFIYQPLIDWSCTHDSTFSNTAVGTAVTLAVYG
ncbi:unnamed protein product [Dracunculus medinensis]|uniref:PI3K/PI4K catalytic domain-containing protein n=1 Tax=Dracunculus medinensis TaxID=318479 RepID=A0A3P7T2E2_DRAME|nr:unnamed protein product [Dracunculus medinensis]